MIRGNLERKNKWCQLEVVLGGAIEKSSGLWVLVGVLLGPLDAIWVVEPRGRRFASEPGFAS